MTLAAEPVGFVKIYRFSAGKVEPIPVLSIVAVKTPAALFTVIEHDIIMEFFELSSLEVDFHLPVTVRTGEYPLCKRRRRNLDIPLLSGGGLLGYAVVGRSLITD